jgi:hypothetical protein
MPIPESTSAESFASFVGGRLLRVGEGKAWREVKAWATSLPQVVGPETKVQAAFNYVTFC